MNPKKSSYNFIVGVGSMQGVWKGFSALWKGGKQLLHPHVQPSGYSGSTFPAAPAALSQLLKLLGLVLCGQKEQNNTVVSVSSLYLTN